MRVACTTIVFLSLFTLHAAAQNASVKGKVLDKNGAGVPAATVSILKAVDSSWVRSELAEDNGSFTIANVPAGSYLLDVSAVGYERAKQAVILKAGLNDDLILNVQKKSTSLEEVTVTGKKSFIENGLGKTIVNMEATGMGTGSNVLDVLRKLPGITVDGNNNISMAGKQGVLVLINDKETYMSAEQLADYLKSMSADEVAQLELISQPSAKYDASGSAGIINIKTKRNRKPGFNGTEDLEGAIGLYPAIFQNLQLNYNKNKLSLHANVDYLNAVGWIKINRQRNFLDPQTGDVVGYNNSLMESKEYFSDNKLQLAADYNFSAKTTVGLSGSGVYHPNHQSTWTDATIGDDASNTVVYDHALTLNKFLRTNVITNGYVKHEFNKETSLDVNLDYVNYGQHTFQSTTNEVHDAQYNTLPGLQLQGDLPFAMNVYSAKADFTTAVGKIKWETGLKSSLVSIDNDAGYSILDGNNNWVPDTLRSNHFTYNENVNAAYINASKEFNKKWQAQAGLRAEQVNINALQHVGGQQFSKNIFSVFPTAYLSYKADDNNQMELNYGRRIERPNYKRLDPFIYFIDQYNYSVGNPNLKPEYSDNIELKHIYKSALTTILRCSRTSDVINTVVIPDANTKETYRTDENVGTRQSASVSVSYNRQLYKWFLLAISSDAWFSDYAGKLLDKELKADGGGCFVSVDSQFIYGKWTGELYYNYKSASRDDLLVTSKPEHYFSVFVSRKLLHDTCTVKLHLRDPLNISHSSEYSAFDNTVSNVNYKWQSQQVALSINYNFGKNTATQKHESNLDEMKRMN